MTKIKIIWEDNRYDKLYYFYDITGVAGFKYKNLIYHYIKNVDVDIIATIDSTKNVIGRYTYDAYGNTTLIKD